MVQKLSQIINMQMRSGMYIVKYLSLFLFLTWNSAIIQVSAQYSILDSGAVPDGKTVCTDPIQSAIDHCHNAGGGMVYFPAGKYLSGTLVLKSHVSLYLENGAVLTGSTDLKDFQSKIPGLRSYTDNYTERSLIYAEHAENISIRGDGEIYGQGEKFARKAHPYKIRPYIIRMIGCKGVTIEGITLRNSPMWVQHYLACENLLIDGITVDSRHSNLNNDGIDIDACRDVRITNCLIDAEDDAIVLKSTLPEPCENVVIDNCVLSSLCNAFKCGTESVGGFRNIIFTNSIIRDTRLSGIALEIVDGGVMENVIIDNIVIDRTMNPFFIRLGGRQRPHTDGYETGTGSLSGVSISNVIARDIGGLELYEEDQKSMPDALIPSSVTGLPGNPVRNIRFTNIILELPGGGTLEDVGDSIPEQIKRYPEFNMFGVLPAGTFYVRHAEDITFDHIQVIYKKEESRPAFWFDDVGGIIFTRIDTEGSTPCVLKNQSTLK